MCLRTALSRRRARVFEANLKSPCQGQGQWTLSPLWTPVCEPSKTSNFSRHDPDANLCVPLQQGTNAWFCLPRCQLLVTHFEHHWQLNELLSCFPPIEPAGIKEGDTWRRDGSMNFGWRSYTNWQKKKQNSQIAANHNIVEYDIVWFCNCDLITLAQITQMPTVTCLDLAVEKKVAGVQWSCMLVITVLWTVPECQLDMCKWSWIPSTANNSEAYPSGLSEPSRHLMEVLHCFFERHFWQCRQ